MRLKVPVTADRAKSGTFTSIEPTGRMLPNLTLQLPLAGTKGLRIWFDATGRAGKTDTRDGILRIAPGSGHGVPALTLGSCPS